MRWARVGGSVAGEELGVAGALGGEPAPSPPVTGFSLRPMEELPDQIGLWHRDDIAVLASRYERLRA